MYIRRLLKCTEYISNTAEKGDFTGIRQFINVSCLADKVELTFQFRQSSNLELPSSIVARNPYDVRTYRASLDTYWYIATGLLWRVETFCDTIYFEV